MPAPRKAKGLDGTVVPAQAADEPPFHILGYLISNKNQGYPLEPTRRISPGPIGRHATIKPADSIPRRRPPFLKNIAVPYALYLPVPRMKFLWAEIDEIMEAPPRLP
jgi:hypothetical protein